MGRGRQRDSDKMFVMWASLQRLAAFTTSPEGGNPAGVWIGDSLPPPQGMQQIAAEVGYSETAFLAPAGADDEWIIRYYSPEMEVEFCGHATIASAVALADRSGDGPMPLHTAVLLHTVVGEVPVIVETRDGLTSATLTTVEPQRRDVPDDVLDQALAALEWSRDALDPALAPDLAFAGAWHLVLGVAERQTLAELDYDFEALKTVMTDTGLTTVQIVWRENDLVVHSRNPFPVGGVIEDPATGAAAAALAGSLRLRGLVDPPTDLTIHQGVDMGRPSVIHVHIPTTGGIEVTGTAVPIAG